MMYLSKKNLIKSIINCQQHKAKKLNKKDYPLKKGNKKTKDKNLLKDRKILFYKVKYNMIHFWKKNMNKK